MSNSLTTTPNVADSGADMLRRVEQDFGASAFNYKEAFSRNLGLISEEEQEKLRNSRVAIAGMGGVGGIHLITLARLGIGKFTIADPDTFELANMNRQYGARMDTLGRNKAKVMAEEALRINPEIEVDIFSDGIRSDNVAEFMREADLFVDGMDLFEMDLRRRLFQRAALNGIHALTAGPMGFSVAWITFAPDGIAFDRYFDVDDSMSDLEKVIAFVIGVAPKATHRAYLDLSYVNLRGRHGPSVAAACDFTAGVIGTESVKILLNRGQVPVAPRYSQFDAYVGKLRSGQLLWGNRNPLQRFKRWYLMRLCSRLDG